MVLPRASTSTVPLSPLREAVVPSREAVRANHRAANWPSTAPELNPHNGQSTPLQPSVQPASTQSQLDLSAQFQPKRRCGRSARALLAFLALLCDSTDTILYSFRIARAQKRRCTGWIRRLVEWFGISERLQSHDTMAVPPNKIDLQADWERACLRFLQTTKRDPKKRPVPTPEDVIQMVAASASRHSRSKEKMDRVKDVLGKTLDFVTKFGTIVGTAASMAFPPSSMCVNAVTFLIDAGKAYGNIFSALETLFSRIFEALQRVNHYMKDTDNLPPEMAQIAHEILLKFLSICELSHKVLESNKFLQVLKTLAFNSDAGVKCELESLERLEVKESRMGVAVTVTTTKAIQREVSSGLSKQTDEIRGLGDAIKGTREEIAKRNQIEVIRRNLGNPLETYTQDYSRLNNSLLPGSGEWTLRQPDIVAWKNAQNADTGIIFLAAEQGFGKTYVFTRILRDLQKQYKNGLEATDRVSVAYLYLDQDTRSLDGSAESSGSTSASARRGPSLGLILGSWAIQIAQNDTVYCKDLFQSYQKRPGVSDDLDQLVKRLFSGRSPSKATFFLLVDALDALADAEEADGRDPLSLLQQTLDQISAMSSQTVKIKLLLTGPSKMTESLAEKLSASMKIISIASENAEDVEKYVTLRIDQMEVFRSRQGIDLKEELRTGLIEKLKGNFRYADYLLKRIAKEQRPSAIRKIIDTAEVGKRGSGTIESDIRRCNKTLDPVGDIPDLNVLLLWLIYAFKPLTVRQLKEALRIHGREVVLTFFDQLRDRFSLFLTVNCTGYDEGATVELASDDIKEFLKKQAQSIDSNESVQKENVTEGEIRLLRNIIQSFCETSLYEKLGFDGFFAEKLGNSNAVIGIPESGHAHAEIALRCLMAINEDAIHRGGLLRYSLHSLEKHLQQVEDLSLIDPTLKSKIGVQLVLFLTGTNGARKYGVIDTGMWFDDKLYNEIERFLQDGAVKKSLTSEQKEWIKKSTGSDAQAGSTLFDAMAIHLSRQWLKAEPSLFICLVGYMNKTEHEADPNVERLVESNYSDENLSLDTIYNITAWAWQHVDSKVAETIGKLTLGKTLRLAAKYEEACEAFEAAKKAMGGSMSADVEIAKTWAAKEEWRKAILILKPVVDACKRGDEVFGEDQDFQFDVARAQLAKWYSKAEMLEEASTIYHELFEANLSFYDEIGEAIALYEKQKRFDEVIAIAKRMEKENDECEQGMNRVQAMICSTFHTESLILFKAAHETGELEFIREQYEGLFNHYLKGMKELVDDWLITKYAELKMSYALMAHRYDQDPEQKQHIEKHMLDVLALESKKSMDSDIIYLLRLYQGKCFHQLIRFHTDYTMAVGPQSAEGVETTAKVKEMVRYIHEEDLDDHFAFNSSAARAILGRYFSKIGQLEQAKEQLRANMQVAMTLLSDNDPDNDWDGYRKLGDTLMNYGDLKNAVAAWSLIRPTIGLDGDTAISSQRKGDAINTPAAPHDATEGINVTKTSDLSTIGSKNTFENDEGDPSPATASGDDASERTGSPSSQSPSPPLLRRSASIGALSRLYRPQGPINYFCDGLCGKEWTYADDFYVCRDCADVQFCPPCHAKLLSGKMQAEDLCSMEHEFMYIPPWDRSLNETLGPDHVLCDGEALSIPDWLGRIRLEWAITN